MNSQIWFSLEVLLIKYVKYIILGTERVRLKLFLDKNDIKEKLQSKRGPHLFKIMRRCTLILHVNVEGIMLEITKVGG